MKKHKLLTVRMDEHEFAILRAAARSAGETMSAMVIRLLRAEHEKWMRTVSDRELTTRVLRAYSRIAPAGALATSIPAVQIKRTSPIVEVSLIDTRTDEMLAFFKYLPESDDLELVSLGGVAINARTT